MEDNVSLLSMDLREKISAYNIYKQQDLTESEFLEICTEVESGVQEQHLEDLIAKYKQRLRMDRDYEKIRYGLDLNFDIYYILDENAHTIFYKTEEIEIGNRIFPLRGFYSEMEQRMTILNKHIKEILGLEDIDILQPR